MDLKDIVIIIITVIKLNLVALILQMILFKQIPL